MDLLMYVSDFENLQIYFCSTVMSFNPSAAGFKVRSFWILRAWNHVASVVKYDLIMFAYPVLSCKCLCLVDLAFL